MVPLWELQQKALPHCPRSPGRNPDVQVKALLCFQSPPGVASRSDALKAPGISPSPFPWLFPLGFALLLILCIQKMKEKGRAKIYGSLYTPSRKTYVHRAHKSSNSGLCLQEFNIHNAPIFILVLPMNITE